jgi:hypothetical protein
MECVVGNERICDAAGSQRPFELALKKMLGARDVAVPEPSRTPSQAGELKNVTSIEVPAP